MGSSIYTGDYTYVPREIGAFRKAAPENPAWQEGYDWKTLPTRCLGSLSVGRKVTGELFYGEAWLRPCMLG